MFARAMTRGGSLSQLGWGLAALASGVIAGAVAAGGQQVLAVAILLALAFAALVMWRIELGLLVMVLAMPLDVYGRIVSDPLPLTVFQVALGVTLLAWAARVLVDARRWLKLSTADIGMAALVLAGAISVTFSMAPSDSVYATARMVALWAFTLVAANVMGDERSLKRVFSVLLATGAVFGLFGFAQEYVPGFELGNTHLTLAADGSVNLSRAAGFFQDPNYFAGFLSAAVVASFAFAVHAKGRRDLLKYLMVAALSGAGLVATLSRTGWVGAAFGCAVVALTAPSGRRIRIVTSGVALALVALLVAPGQVASRAVSVFDTERDTSNITRWGMYVSTIQMIEDDWVVGTGIDAFDQVYPDYRQPGTHITVARPHELPLALWAEMGVLGLAAEVLLAGGVVLLFWPRRGREWSVYESAALAGLGALLLETFFQYYLYFEYLWLFVALCVVASRLARQDKEGAH